LLLRKELIFLSLISLLIIINIKIIMTEGLTTYNTISGGSIFQKTGANLMLEEWAG
jgi:hypothetical protein